MRCHECRTVLPDESRFCLACGEPISPILAESGIDPIRYRHPDDTEWLSRLHGTAGLDSLLRKVTDHGIEDLLLLQYAGSYLEVTPGLYPRLEPILARVCRTLGVTSVPKTYVMMEDRIDGTLVGSDHPRLVLHNEVFERLNPQEMHFFLGRLIGHAACGHVAYMQLAMVLPHISGSLGAATFGVGGIVASGLQAVLTNWLRAAALSADRAGLLCCGDEDAALTALSKMAGAPATLDRRIDPDLIRAQAETFRDASADGYGRLARILSGSFFRHPWTIHRASEMLGWAKTDNPDAIRNEARNPGDKQESPMTPEPVEIEELNCDAEVEMIEERSGPVKPTSYMDLVKMR